MMMMMKEATKWDVDMKEQVVEGMKERSWRGWRPVARSFITLIIVFTLGFPSTLYAATQ